MGKLWKPRHRLYAAGKTDDDGAAFAEHQAAIVVAGFGDLAGHDLVRGSRVGGCTQPSGQPRKEPLHFVGVATVALSITTEQKARFIEVMRRHLHQGVADRPPAFVMDVDGEDLADFAGRDEVACRRTGRCDPAQVVDGE